MITIEKTEVLGWEAAIRGMRNPMNSWDRSDTVFWAPLNITTSDDIANDDYPKYSESQVDIGKNDQDLMTRLADSGPVHAKYRRMIVVYADITAPLYWWKEFDTYKVGTVANSCSTMHKIHAKEFMLDDFSHDQLIDYEKYRTNEVEGFVLNRRPDIYCAGLQLLSLTINVLNAYREEFLRTKDKEYWWQMIQLLPSSYNQKRTVMLNYEVLSHIFPDRKDHKLDEWREFCKWIKTLPYSELITGKIIKNDSSEGSDVLMGYCANCGKELSSRFSIDCRGRCYCDKCK